jgi:hypothetical protein
MDFQIVGSWGCFGQSGKTAPAVMTISAPQQTVLNTPNSVFISPFLGTTKRDPLQDLYVSKHMPKDLIDTFSVICRWNMSKDVGKSGIGGQDAGHWAGKRNGTRLIDLVRFTSIARPLHLKEDAYVCSSLGVAPLHHRGHHINVS